MWVTDDLAGAAIVKVYIKDNKTLFVLVPGQPDYELVPVEKDKFSLKIINGYFCTVRRKR
jgi:hypothetical protein